MWPDNKIEEKPKQSAKILAFPFQVIDTERFCRLQKEADKVKRYGRGTYARDHWWDLQEADIKEE
jgi:hypothetical protein